MAVDAIKYDSDLVLKVQIGTDPGTGIGGQARSATPGQARSNPRSGARCGRSHRRAAGAPAGGNYPAGRPAAGSGIEEGTHFLSGVVFGVGGMSPIEWVFIISPIKFGVR